MYIHVCVCMCLYVCVCVWVHVCICMNIYPTVPSEYDYFYFFKQCATFINKVVIKLDFINLFMF